MRPGFLKYVKKNLNDPHYYWLVAKDDKKVVGYFYANIIKKYGTHVKKGGFILDGFVLEKYRRLGICKAAVQQIVKWLKRHKIRLVELRVSSYNDSALKAWKRLGFSTYVETLKTEI